MGIKRIFEKYNFNKDIEEMLVELDNIMEGKLEDWIITNYNTMLSYDLSEKEKIMYLIGRITEEESNKILNNEQSTRRYKKEISKGEFIELTKEEYDNYCPYCMGHQQFEDEVAYIWSNHGENKIILKAYDSDGWNKNYGFKIKYCPMCGRKLGDNNE